MAADHDRGNVSAVEKLLQRHSASLAEHMKNSVLETTAQLYSNQLVTTEVKHWAVSALGVSDYHKALRVLGSAEDILKHSPDLLSKFLSTLVAADSTFDQIVNKMSEDYEGEYHGKNIAITGC